VISQKQKEEKLLLFSAFVALKHFHFHRANNETTTSPPGGTFFCSFALFVVVVSYTHGEEKGKRSEKIGKIQKCETFARWETKTNSLLLSSIQRGRRVSVASLDHRNDRERYADKDMILRLTMFNKFIPMVTSRSHR